MRSKRNIRCCGEQYAIMSRDSGGQWCGSLPAERICLTNRQMFRCPTRLQRDRSPFSSLELSLVANREDPKQNVCIPMNRIYRRKNEYRRSWKETGGLLPQRRMDEGAR